MEVIRDLKEIPNLSLALGFFDGVHLAHQKVIQGAIDFAKENCTKSAVVTFEKQPLCYLKNIEPEYIFSREKNYKIIEDLGVDYIVELDFDKIVGLSSFDYLKNILIKYFSPYGIFTGFNHHFGCNREGNSEFLKAYQEKFNYKYFSIPAQEFNGKVISSSAIRKFIQIGDIEKANLMLGREFSVSGKVIEGNKIGRTISFPTANIIYPNDIIEPVNGVYGVKIKLQDGKFYSGIANFGIKPTISECERKTLETHIIGDFKENIYGQEIEVCFNNFVREEKKFNNIEELKNQINKDISSLGLS